MSRTRPSSSSPIFNGNLPDHPSAEDIQRIKQQLLESYADVFATDSILKPMSGDPVKIHLDENAQPFALTAARQVPFAMRQSVKEEIQKLLNKEIIERVGDEPTTWCHPLVAVRKPDGKTRICVDLTKLNKFVSRPHHPLRSSKDATDAIQPSDVYFSKLDMLMGYWQMPLAEESRHLTTFICQEGRFRFRRAPMGLVSSGDDFNRRGDQALQDILNVEKVVDDILIHTETFKDHISSIIAILERCRHHSITLNPAKFTFAAESVDFVGYRIGKHGIQADPAKVAAIVDFPTPTNISELRSFFGMVNQLGQFSMEVASAAEPLRPLLKSKNIFQWLPDHTIAFNAVKSALASPPILSPFDPDLPVELHTDASRTRGLGFALLQRSEDGHPHLIQCGSRFLTEAETRYATVEIEMLGAAWVVNKCHIYLAGLKNFTIFVDHKPLIPVLNNKTLDAIKNPA